MRAVVQTGYGAPEQILAVRDLARPAPAPDEVLVRVHAASVHPDVWHVVWGWPYVLRAMGAGLRRPKDPVPGTDMAGVVAAVGAEVTRFRPGDEVFGETLRGMQWRNGGAFAEYVAAPASGLATKPADVTFVEAAAVPTAGLIGLHNLPGRQLPTAGQRVLVNGAAGGVGGIVVQLAKAGGAHVTGVDRPDKLDLVRSLGADATVDYTGEDYTRGGGRYDLIVDIPGNRPFRECRRVLAPDGTYVLIGHDGYGTTSGRWLGSLPKILPLMVRAPFVEQLPKAGFSTPDKQASMAVLRDLLDTGCLTPVIDRTFQLEEVAAAVQYLASGDARGRVVLTV